MGKRKKKKKMLVELMPESNGHTGTPSQEHNCLSHLKRNRINRPTWLEPIAIIKSPICQYSQILVF